MAYVKDVFTISLNEDGTLSTRYMYEGFWFTSGAFTRKMKKICSKLGISCNVTQVGGKMITLTQYDVTGDFQDLAKLQEHLKNIFE